MPKEIAPEGSTQPCEVCGDIVDSNDGLLQPARPGSAAEASSYEFERVCPTCWRLYPAVVDTWNERPLRYYVLRGDIVAMTGGPAVGPETALE
jgi:hypothetical protein